MSNKYEKKITSIKKAILNKIFKYVDKNKYVIFLYGSFAKNTIYKDSDIDIGLIGPESIENLKLVKLKEDLEKNIKTLRDIDIVDFSAVDDTEFLKTALEEIKIWHKTENSRIYLNNLKKQIQD